MVTRWTRKYPILGKLTQVHWIVVALISAIALFGFAMMISASGGHLKPWAAPQMSKFLVGFVLMLGIAITPSRLLLRHAYVVYALCLAILVAVLILGFMGKGAQRWVDTGIFVLQPSELMKIALILALARYFHGLHPEDIERRLLVLIPALLLTLVPAVFILKQPNLGTTTILVAVAGIMFFIAGVRIRYFVIVAVAGICAAPVAWHFLHDYQKQRVLTFLDPSKDPLGSGYNILQSMIAIGSGGMFGKGYLQGSQGQLDFLPEKHTDFIFTMVSEEFGFFGATFLLLLYALLLAYGVAIGIRSRSTFGGLLAIGVSAMLFIHIMINVAMVMGMIPVVGVPLPLLSYGGTIMMSMMMGFGLMLNAYVHRDVTLPRSG